MKKITRFHIQWHIIEACNLRCKHCYGEAGAMRNTQLTEEQIYSILDKLSDGCNSVSITGGDPMCHPKIKEIIKYSIARGFETTLITNGMRLNQNWAMDLCQYSRHKNSNFYAVFLKASSSC